MNTCKNCTHEFEGKYCSQCGQKGKTERITTRSLSKDALEFLFPMNKGFWYTARQMTIRPGHTAREYIEGKRVKLTKPFKYAALSTAAIVLILKFFQPATVNFAQLGETGKHAWMAELILRYPSLTLLFTLPVYAATLKIVFWKRPYNFAEYLTMMCFFVGQYSLLSCLFTPWASLKAPVWVSLAVVPLMLVYYVWFFRQFFGISVMRSLLSVIAVTGLSVSLTASILLPAAWFLNKYQW